MKNKLYKKGLVFGIVILFIGSCLVPGIGGKHGSSEVNEESQVITSGVSNSATLSLHTFDKTVEKQKNNVEIPADAANEINIMLEELKQKIVNEPMSDETKALKIEFVDLLDMYGLLPSGLSKDYVLSLLNPSWLNNKQKIPRMRPIFPVLRNFVSRILGVFANLQQFFKMRFGKTASQDIIGDILPTSPYSQTGTAVFCSMGSGGQGSVLPLFLLPRPRGIAVWSATDGVTAVAELLSPVGAGFGAEGAQSGLVLGFIGLGLTFAYPGEMVYGFFGYALFTSVSADNIVFFPPNAAPIISDENPADGTWDVPLSLSELSFRISDPEDKLMSYTVTTDPDIGSGSGILKTNGVYSVSISGLEYDKKYSWTVEVKDDQATAVKQFSFFTVFAPPFDPFDEGWQYHKKIAIDHTMVDGDIENFPILISLTDVDLRDKAQSDGDDILFMDGSDVATKLYHEIESFYSSTGELHSWVRIPNLSASVDTVLYIYYGNPGCSSQEFPERVWDSSYCGVWHLDNFYDSTINNNDGTNHGTDDVTGKIGSAKDFVSSNSEYVDLGDMQEPCDNTIGIATFEMWIKPDSLTDGMLLTKHNSEVEPDKKTYEVEMRNDGKIRFEFWSGTWYPSHKKIIVTTDDAYVSIASWQHIVAVANVASRDVKIYYDGDEKSSTTVIEGVPLPYFYDISWFEHLGRNTGSSSTRYYDGCMDEVRISKTCRSEAWIITSYNTMNDPSSFFSVGPEESAP
jgi:hypothetical protein